jgi:hypothetical protein
MKIGTGVCGAFDAGMLAKSTSAIWLRRNC